MQQWRLNSEDTTIDIWRLLQSLWQKAWVVLAMAIVFGVSTFFYSTYFITPTYRAGFTAYVNNRINVEGTNSTNTGDLNASIGLTYLYEEIISSRSVLMDAADNCEVPCSYAELAGMVTTGISENAAIITVYVEDTDPVRATQLATAIAEVAPEHVARVVDGSSMRIVDAPIQPTGKFAPNNLRNAMLGFVTGLLIAIVGITALEIINDSVQNAEDLENRYQIVVVGSVPDFTQAERIHDGYSYCYRKAGGKKQ